MSSSARSLRSEIISAIGYRTQRNIGDADLALPPHLTPSSRLTRSPSITSRHSLSSPAGVGAGGVVSARSRRGSTSSERFPPISRSSSLNTPPSFAPKSGRSTSSKPNGVLPNQRLSRASIDTESVRSLRLSESTVSIKVDEYQEELPSVNKSVKEGIQNNKTNGKKIKHKTKVETEREIELKVEDNDKDKVEIAVAKATKTEVGDNTEAELQVKETKEEKEKENIENTNVNRQTGEAEEITEAETTVSDEAEEKTEPETTVSEEAAEKADTVEAKGNEPKVSETKAEPGVKEEGKSETNIEETAETESKAEPVVKEEGKDKTNLEETAETKTDANEAKEELNVAGTTDDILVTEDSEKDGLLNKDESKRGKETEATSADTGKSQPSEEKSEAEATGDTQPEESVAANLKLEEEPKGESQPDESYATNLKSDETDTKKQHDDNHSGSRQDNNQKVDTVDLNSNDTLSSHVKAPTHSPAKTRRFSKATKYKRIRRNSRSGRSIKGKDSQWKSPDRPNSTASLNIPPATDSEPPDFEPLGSGQLKRHRTDAHRISLEVLLVPDFNAQEAEEEEIRQVERGYESDYQIRGTVTASDSEDDKEPNEMHSLSSSRVRFVNHSCVHIPTYSSNDSKNSYYCSHCDPNPPKKARKIKRSIYKSASLGNLDSNNGLDEERYNTLMKEIQTLLNEVQKQRDDFRNELRALAACIDSRHNQLECTVRSCACSSAKRRLKMSSQEASKDAKEEVKDTKTEEKENTNTENSNEENKDDKSESPSTSATPEPKTQENGDDAPGTPKALTLREQFRNFSKFGDTKSDGKLLTLSQSDKWFKQAKVIDGKTITTTDTAINFNKMKIKKITFVEFEKYLDEIAKAKKMDVTEIKNKLKDCGAPGTSGTTSVVKSSAVDRLTDTKKYTGSHKLRFDSTGRGKGLSGRKDVPDGSGYVTGYKNKNTYDKSH